MSKIGKLRDEGLGVSKIGKGMRVSKGKGMRAWSE